MGALVSSKTSPVGKKIEVDVQELILRLQSIADGCNIEVVRLAISTMLEEIDDAIGNNKTLA
jgi:hypothetical protein